MSKTTKFNFKIVKTFSRITWRDTWYSVVVWIAAIGVGGFVILPLYYLVLPLVVFWTTTIYFHKSDKTLKAGLWCSLFWFFAVLALDAVEIIGPYYSNAAFYFSDPRNLLKYPLILLIPVIYSLVLEMKTDKKKAFGKHLSRELTVASH